MAHHVDDDLHLQGYQDDLDTHGTDLVTHEETDSPADYTGIANRQLKEELNKLAVDDEGTVSTAVSDDEREMVEDEDQGDLDNPDQTATQS